MVFLSALFSTSVNGEDCQEAEKDGRPIRKLFDGHSRFGAKGFQYYFPNRTKAQLQRQQ